MNYVLDTHVVIWFLEGNTRLPHTTASLLRGKSETVVIPTIVIAECWHYLQKRSFSLSVEELQDKIVDATNAVVHPLDEAVLRLLPNGLELHDAIIVATALHHRDVLHRSVRLVTTDARIRARGLVDVLW